MSHLDATSPSTQRPGSVLAQLRALVPERPSTRAEAYRITEHQAELLRRLLGITTPELPDEAIADLPHVEVIAVDDLQSSGVSQWSHGRWVIATNGEEPWQRQRFSTGHELWHIINYRTTDWLCPPDRFTTTATKAERLADYFSGCLHMPRRQVRRLVADGLDAEDMAEVFGMSQAAVQVRLSQLGLSSRDRCARTVGPPSGAGRSSYSSITAPRRTESYQTAATRKNYNTKSLHLEDDGAITGGL